MKYDYRKSKAGKRRFKYPAIYKLSLWIQSILFKIGISWHNAFSDECTIDFSCCHKYRIKKVDSNYGYGILSWLYSDSPDERWIIEEKINWFWGWKQYKDIVFVWESDALKYMNSLTNHTA